MTSVTFVVTGGSAIWRRLAATPLAWPVASLSLLLAAQLCLIFTKSFNWDEFLHFSMVYQLRQGTLDSPFQTLLMRLLTWAPSVSTDLVTQMMTARVFAWSWFLVGLGAIFGVARQFVTDEDALWTTLVYLGAGNVFAHGFAIRADPFVMAVLMLALYLLASNRLNWSTVTTIGALLGFAEILTVKAIFYGPCFVGIAWWRWSSSDDKPRTLSRLAAIPLIAAATFAVIYLFHRSGLASIPTAEASAAFVSNGSQWLTEGLIRQPLHTLVAFITAPVLSYALIKAPSVWHRSGLGRDKVIMLATMALPLVVILFYRNVFPYFFVFLFAPVAIAISPAIAELRRNHGRALLAAAICITPIIKFVVEPRDVLARQQALIGYIHREFPTGTHYLGFCGIVADYPRVLNRLVSGPGLGDYNKRGIPLVAQAAMAGKLAFVIGNAPAISLALEGSTAVGGLLAEDVAALHSNYIRVSDNLWLAGKQLPAGGSSISMDVPIAGKYVVDGGALAIDGVKYHNGAVAELDAGRHEVAGQRSNPIVLWRGKRRPSPPASVSAGPLFTNY